MKPLLLLLCLLPSLNCRCADFTTEFPLHKKTKFFDFYAKRNEAGMARIGRFADAFIELVNRDFFKADFDYPIRVLVLEDRVRFQDFLRREMLIKDPPGFGIYLPEFKLFATYEDSGLGTFAHEILHPLTMSNLPNMPVWALEGIPTFFEKFYGYWRDDQLVLELGFQNPWRIELIGDKLPELDLAALVGTRDSQGKFRESDVRMLSMFLWKQGRFHRLLELIQKNDRGGYPSYFEAAMELPMDNIRPLWQAYLNEVHSHHRENLRLPISTVLADEDNYRRFKMLHDLKPER
jgi:hypothetical protein